MSDSASRSQNFSLIRSGVLLLAMIAVAAAGLCRENSRAAAADGTQSPQSSGETPTVDVAAQAPKNPFPKRFPAPSLDGGTEWLNTTAEISLKDLRGKVVLLDFWTYCCINCIHVLPDLKFLEQKYDKELVVIGVHVAKFANEEETENIRKAIVRYEIEHPVVNDSKKLIARKFQFQAWPTLAVIDPEGQFCGFVSGEGHRDLLDKVIQRLVTFHKAKGTLDRTPVHFDLEREKRKPTPLKFPGKVLADETGDRLFISDSNHNRIVITTLDGKLIDIVGSGAMGRKNGNYDEASFDHPQGMALVGDVLYVADTENHLLRTVDLKKRTVGTLAGTGKQARTRVVGGKLRTTPLNSPWDLEHVDGRLYICMAGPHQIWSHRLRSDRIGVFSGNGHEDVGNGLHRNAKFAQPSGITWDGKYLYVADSEGSAVRRVEPSPKGKVNTIAGTSDLPLGRSLFEFGDRDGNLQEARLQHPIGVVWHKGVVYVADSYNHKIRKIEATDRGPKISTWLGDGEVGTSTKPPRFSEPAGLCVAKDKLYIADTNNHRICVADLTTGEVTELKVDGLKPPEAEAGDAVDASDAPKPTKLNLRTVRANGKLTIRFPLELPEGYKLNPLFPHRIRMKSDDKQTIVDVALLGKPQISEDGKSLSVTVPLGEKPGTATFEMSLTFGFCREGKGGLCKLQSARWILPLQTSADANESELSLKVDARPAAIGQ